ncbi:MAG: response regulator [Desulfuromonadales bacterium]|nr:response regulator [Desulfuromonadales bacterium]
MGLRILIAEDDAQTRELLEKILALRGWESRLCADGNQALAAWAEGGFSLLLLDLAMPGMDGAEVTREVRRQEGSSRRTPIIIYSATVWGQGRGVELEGVDVDEYLPKPVRIPVPCEAISRYLGAAGPALPSSK